MAHFAKPEVNRILIVEAPAVLLNGAMNAAVLWAGHKGDKAGARMEKALTELLVALKR